MSDSPQPRAETEALVVRDLGRMAYAEAYAIQQETLDGVYRGEGPETLLVVEHEPVITVSKRQSAAGHVLHSAERLAAMGITLEATDRGGDVTYHGPGQLVAYPIVRLAPRGLNAGSYMRLLEGVIIETLDHFGIAGHREQGATGVWVPLNAIAKERRPIAPIDGPATAKIAALGIRIRRNIAMHGLALNVDPDLSHFGTIVPCGLTGRPVTSMAQVLGDQPDFDEVKAHLTATLQRHLAV